MDSQFKRSPVSRKCCVSNCPHRFIKMHRFPKNEPEIFNAWLQRIKPPNYEKLTVLEIYNKYYVCHQHFAEDCLVKGTRRGLRKDAIPSLNIPETVESLSYLEDQRPPCDEAVAGPSRAANLTISFTSPDKERKIIPPSIGTVAGPSTTPDFEIIPAEIDAPTTPICRHKEQKNTIGFKTRKHTRILADVNVTRAVDLTPKARKLYQRASSWSIRMARMHNKITSYQQRLANCEKYINSPQFDNLLQYVNTTSYKFVMSQVKNQQLKPHARRYTLDEKIFALSIAKTSGKAYRLLSKIFVLPSVRTLSTLLSKVTFHAGLNQYVFLSLHNIVKKMKCAQEKVCILMFDEMAIDTGLFYHRGEDCILGFEDDGENRTARLANHANVFLLKGLYRQWKQPISFTFSNGPVKAQQLQVMIKKIILECQKIGLEIIATVCDQGSANQSAIKALLEESRRESMIQNVDYSKLGFILEGHEIIPLYDVPHLMKGLRNNLLNKDLHFVLNGKNKVAKWSHIEKFYALDSSEPNLRMCSKLTDAHVIKEKINKMKVKNCTQVFSHTVGALMKRITQWDIKDNNFLSEEVEDTADLILFLDKLFDSLNVSGQTQQDAKPLKRPITKTSEHEEFWKNALSIIRSMKFYCLKNKRFVNIPTLKNLIFSLERIIYLKDILLLKKNFKYVLTRGLNQDPLENFFGYIRSHGYRNINPDVPHFISSFKTLILNNFVSSHSPGSNCEEDMGTGLDNMRSFFTDNIIREQLDENISVQLSTDTPPIQGRTKVARCTLIYISGYIGKVLKKDIKTCENCHRNIIVQHTIPVDEDFIDCREYDYGNLIRPGNYLYFLCSNSICSLFYLIPRIGIKRAISKFLAEILQKMFSFTPINCPEHNLGYRLCIIIIRCVLFWWCKSVTKIAKGKDIKFSKYLLKKPHAVNIDPIKLHAYKLYQSRAKYKKKF